MCVHVYVHICTYITCIVSWMNKAYFNNSHNSCYLLCSYVTGTMLSTFHELFLLLSQQSSMEGAIFVPNLQF